VTAIQQELKRYAEIRAQLYQIKGFGGTSINAAISYAVADMINELNNFATNKVEYLKSENEYLLGCISKLKEVA